MSQWQLLLCKLEVGYSDSPNHVCVYFEALWVSWFLGFFWRKKKPEKPRKPKGQTLLLWGDFFLALENPIVLFKFSNKIFVQFSFTAT